MLYNFLYPLSEHFFVFNVFRYITFRAAMASIFAFLISVWIGPMLIKFLTKKSMSHSHDREGFSDISSATAHKASIPTMGGLIIIGSILMSLLLWGDLSNRYLGMAAMSMIWLGIVGFIDDVLKLMNKNSKGILAITKFSGQTFLGVVLGIFLYYDAPTPTHIGVPFLKDVLIPMGSFYIVFVCLVIVATSNAVNLTDGLDGLAIGCTVLVALTYTIFSYIAGNSLLAEYLYVPYIPDAGELSVFCASIVGAGLGFLWFNSYPASIFMGDTGALSLGGALGAVAILIKKEILLLIVGGVFVMEALSVIFQVIGFRFFAKRPFLMAPIHHHFQLKGWNESKIVARFWIIAVVLSFIGLASLKLR